MNPSSPNQLYYEEQLWNQGYQSVAGLDEAGRGCWAGPVFAAVVMLKPYTAIAGVNDSKKLSPQKREELFDVIVKQALSYGIAFVNHDVIDKINILQASLLAMKMAIQKMPLQPDYLLIDGNQGLDVNIPQQKIIKGDSLSLSVAAASILAKVSRDRLMIEWDKKYPQYKFAKHKGYGTKVHREALEEHGPLPIHRFSFEPVRSLILKRSRQSSFVENLEMEEILADKKLIKRLKQGSRQAKSMKGHFID